MYFNMIKVVVNYLYLRGLAYNDLNPNNIIIDKDSMPILINYGFY